MLVSVQRCCFASETRVAINGRKTNVSTASIFKNGGNGRSDIELNLEQSTIFHLRIRSGAVNHAKTLRARAVV